MNNSCVKNVIESKKVLSINHKLRSLGLNFNLIGTKLINKTIQLVISSSNEFYVLEDIFDELIKIYPTFNKVQVRMAIKYALDHRNEKLTKKNFENIFGYEYDEEIFTTKEFIDEFVYIIL